jgi:hypothetical protein
LQQVLEILEEIIQPKRKDEEDKAKLAIAVYNHTCIDWAIAR